MSQFKVAVYLYPQADVLDFSGPTEMYCYPHSMEENAPTPFSVTSFSHEKLVPSASPALVYQPNMSFDDMAAQITDYDILVIPGAFDKTVLDFVASEQGKQLTALIQKFADAKPRPETGKRFLQSVCTGALILAASGVLVSCKATTHHLSLELLKKVADEVADGGDSGLEVVRQRYVNARTTEAGTRIVTAGGVSSGIDATIYVIGEICGQDKADFVAEISEFERRNVAWGV